MTAYDSLDVFDFVLNLRKLAALTCIFHKTTLSLKLNSNLNFTKIMMKYDRLLIISKMHGYVHILVKLVKPLFFIQFFIQF